MHITMDGDVMPDIDGLVQERRNRVLVMFCVYLVLTHRYENRARVTPGQRVIVNIVFLSSSMVYLGTQES